MLEERVDSGTTAERWFVWGVRSVDDIVLRDSGSGRLYALGDAQNITAVINTSGVVQARYGYTGFGTVRYMNASFGAGSTNDWETLFWGYRYDVETGFYQVRYRYYHSSLGRWVSRDPIGEQDGTCLVCVVHNSPPNRVDPTGLAMFSLPNQGINSPATRLFLIVPPPPFPPQIPFLPPACQSIPQMSGRPRLFGANAIGELGAGVTKSLLGVLAPAAGPAAGVEISLTESFTSRCRACAAISISLTIGAGVAGASLNGRLTGAIEWNKGLDGWSNSVGVAGNIKPVVGLGFSIETSPADFTGYQVGGSVGVGVGAIGGIRFGFGCTSCVSIGANPFTARYRALVGAFRCVAEGIFKQVGRLF